VTFLGRAPRHDR